ncbi:hypothetical protein CPB83DRAFT_840710 [Crepidotus variabilis]|uniref:Uncharacterized protein n=1 Tax=Crepidotus variabilis TaxID=179855 RepID=A0A9P6E429_9AGAR|nr:hypothetical protein CPB83DRAFT_840710 [Crepidotus variabilis]
MAPSTLVPSPASAGKRAKTPWNSYEGYFFAHIETELARVPESDRVIVNGRPTTATIAEAYKAFKKFHLLRHRHILEVFNDQQALLISQTTGPQRERQFLEHCRSFSEKINREKLLFGFETIVFTLRPSMNIKGLSAWMSGTQNGSKRASNYQPKIFFITLKFTYCTTNALGNDHAKDSNVTSVLKRSFEELAVNAGTSFYSGSRFAWSSIPARMRSKGYRLINWPHDVPHPTVWKSKKGILGLNISQKRRLLQAFEDQSHPLSATLVTMEPTNVNFTENAFSFFFAMDHTLNFEVEACRCCRDLSAARGHDFTGRLNDVRLKYSLTKYRVSRAEVQARMLEVHCPSDGSAWPEWRNLGTSNLGVIVEVQARGRKFKARVSENSAREIRSHKLKFDQALKFKFFQDPYADEHNFSIYTSLLDVMSQHRLLYTPPLEPTLGPQCHPPSPPKRQTTMKFNKEQEAIIQAQFSEFDASVILENPTFIHNHIGVRGLKEKFVREVFKQPEFAEVATSREWRDRLQRKIGNYYNNNLLPRLRKQQLNQSSSLEEESKRDTHSLSENGADLCDFSAGIMDAINRMVESQGNTASSVVCISYGTRAADDVVSIANLTFLRNETKAEFAVIERSDGDWTEEWRRYVDMTLPHQPISSIISIPRGKDGLPLFPEVDISKWTLLELIDFLNAYFESLWVFSQPKNNAPIPWKDLADQPAKYYDTVLHPLPVEISTPTAYLNAPSDLFVLLQYFALSARLGNHFRFTNPSEYPYSCDNIFDHGFSSALDLGVTEQCAPRNEILDAKYLDPVIPTDERSRSSSMDHSDAVNLIGSVVPPTESTPMDESSDVSSSGMAIHIEENSLPSSIDGSNADDSSPSDCSVPPTPEPVDLFETFENPLTLPQSQTDGNLQNLAPSNNLIPFHEINSSMIPFAKSSSPTSDLRNGNGPPMEELAMPTRILRSSTRVPGQNLTENNGKRELILRAPPEKQTNRPKPGYFYHLVDDQGTVVRKVQRKPKGAR